ncbi:nucleotidyltransferase domain-containing protein [Candidatus Micrarchaeota archaeon]|nr:nucleotidyltransferase domain-containing protein [Candidatus Micrarchaeota archaeon]
MEKRQTLSKKIILSLLKLNMKHIKQYKVKRIGPFGSSLRDKQRKGSDLDFLVDFEKPTFDNYMDLKFLLERLFHKKVDLVTENSLKPAIRYVKGEAIYVS